MTDITADKTGAEAETGRSAAALKREAVARAAEVRKAVEERAAQAREWAADQTDVLRDTVQTRPFISVGVSAGTAFAAGLVLGILLMRR